MKQIMLLNTYTTSCYNLSATLSLITSSSQLLKIDVDKMDNYVHYKKVYIGFHAETTLKEVMDKKEVAR